MKKHIPAISDYLLLIIAKKQYELKHSFHTISNFIGQILFKRGYIGYFYNKPDEPLMFRRTTQIGNLLYGKIYPGSNKSN
jgi:hypothetical protein